MRDALVMLVDGRMLAYTDLGDPTGSFAMSSMAPGELDWATASPPPVRPPQEEGSP